MSSQAELSLIVHTVDNRIVQQRPEDGYINATALCKAAGRQFHDYSRLGATQRFLEALTAKTGIPVLALVQSIRGGHPEGRGTWVHPWVAVNLAQWLSPEFAVQVSEWVHDWMSGRMAQEALPDHIRRYLVNRHKIPPTHFSMLDQMTLRVLGPLEIHGYVLSNELMPDISLGRMFSRWLREKGFCPDDFDTYDHEFLPGDRRPNVPARLYPNELLTDFAIQVHEWLRDGRAMRYFRARDERAIEPLDRVVAELPPVPKRPRLTPPDDD